MSQTEASTSENNNVYHYITSICIGTQLLSLVRCSITVNQCNKIQASAHSSALQYVATVIRFIVIIVYSVATYICWPCVHNRNDKAKVP